MSDWFLPESERPWTSGNLVVPRVHGAVYFARLVELIGATEADVLAPVVEAFLTEDM